MGLVAARELLLLLLLLAAYGVSIEVSSQQNYYFINVAGPSALIGILMLGAWWQIAREPRALWQPLFWFRIACSAYYGIGALVPYIANDVTVQNIKRYYWFSEEEALAVGVINLLSIIVVLTTAWLISRRQAITETTAPKADASAQSRTLLFAAIFLIGGGIMRYLIVLPVALGLIDLVPGVIIPLAKSYIVGLYLLVLSGMRGNRTAAGLAAVLIPIDLAIGLLTFAKSEVLLTLIFTYLGVLHHKLTLPRVIVGLVIILGVYGQLDPIIHFGRDELLRRHQALTAPLDERIEIMGSYTGTEWEGTERAENQPALSRLSYLHVAAMVVTWHDTGRTGDSLSYALTVLVPRFIWPDKPIITSVGTDLSLAASGNVGSSISPGLFAEAYWNLGWLGIPILMVPLGCILTVFSRYSLNVMREENWLHLPPVLLGVLAGVRVDGFFVADIIGGSATALVYALLAFALDGSLNRRPPKAPPR